MTARSKRLEQILKSVRAWPAERQEAAADVLERMDQLVSAPYALSADERADIEEALAEARRGDFMSDADVAAMFARRGL